MPFLRRLRFRVRGRVRGRGVRIPVRFPPPHALTSHRTVIPSDEHIGEVPTTKERLVTSVSFIAPSRAA